MLIAQSLAICAGSIRRLEKWLAWASHSDAAGPALSGYDRRRMRDLADLLAARGLLGRDRRLPMERFEWAELPGGEAHASTRVKAIGP